jgi:hypothetical protein
MCPKAARKSITPGRRTGLQPAHTRDASSQSRRHRGYHPAPRWTRDEAMRRWVLAVTLFCSALTALGSAPPRFAKWMGFDFVGKAEAAGDRLAQMSKRRDQVPPAEDDSEDENPPPADDEDEENDDNDDEEENDDKDKEDEKE